MTEASPAPTEFPSRPVPLESTQGWGRSKPEGEEPAPVYYPGTEIHGYMPHRGDFARVSVCVRGEGREGMVCPLRSLMTVLRPS